MGFSKTLLVFSLLLVCQGRLGEGRPPLSARIGGVFNSIDSSLGASLAHVVAEINNSSALLPDTRLDQLTAYRSDLVKYSSSLLKNMKVVKFANIVPTVSWVSHWKALTQCADISLTASLPFSLQQSSRCAP